MAVTASGFYGLTLEKCLEDALAKGIDDNDKWTLMVTDSAVPDFDAHDFRADVTSEVAAGSGYTAGGAFNTFTSLAVSTNGTIIYDLEDISWASSTITNAMASITYFTTGAAATDELVFLSDFVTAASTANGTFTIQYSSGGAVIFDFTP